MEGPQPRSVDDEGLPRPPPVREKGCGVSIGETLAEARDQAGLDVTYVSQRTRIREAIIRGIERDDYSACGGEFYARGHIRAIAHVVGADPEPLIREFDAARAPPAISAAEAFQPITPVTVHQRHWMGWATVLGLVLVVVLGFVAYRVLSGSRHAPVALPVSRAHPGAHGHAGHSQPNPARSLVQAANPYAREVVIHLATSQGCSVEFTTPAGGYLSRYSIAPGATKTWTFRRAVDMTLGSPGGIRLTVNGKNSVPPGPATQPVTLSLAPGRPAAVETAPAAAVPARALTPVSVAAFGPGGASQGDNPQLAPLAIDGNPAAGWHTDWYTTAEFGNLQPGTGLLLDMGRTVTIIAAQITLGSIPGADLQLRAGAVPALADLPPAAHAANAGGVLNLRLTIPAHGRYVLIWFTRLPPDPAGTFQAEVHDVRLEGHE